MLIITIFFCEQALLKHIYRFMKKLSLFLIGFFCSISTFAVTWVVSVANFSFSPATVNATVGDVIQFNWLNGGHTTTCGPALAGTVLPSGAAAWNSVMSSGTPTFSYTLTTAGTYTYGCAPHWGGGAGMKGTLVVSGTLPVKLGSFKAVFNNSKVRIDWETITEQNTHYFSVRKSTDGTSFKEIGRVNAAGNSGSALSYNFTDNDIDVGHRFIYYELVTVDIDGKQNHSEIKMVKNGNGANKLIMQLSPNPVTRPGQVQVQFNALKEGKMDVSVYSNAGRLVLRTTMVAFYGLNNAHLHICDFAPGNYTIRFRLDGQQESKKLTIF